MSERVTIADVRRALERIRPDVLACLPAGATLALQQGSPTYGAAWRLYWVPAGETGRHSLPGLSSGYLGWSAREAVLTLDAIGVGLAMRERASK